MIVLSGALVLVALVLLVIGALDRNLPYVYGSIGVSVTALLLLFVSILQRRGQPGSETDATQVSVSSTDEDERVPALAGAGQHTSREQGTANGTSAGAPAGVAEQEPSRTSRLVRRPRQDEPAAADRPDEVEHSGDVEDETADSRVSDADDEVLETDAVHADEDEAAYEDEDEAAYADDDEAAYEAEDEDEGEAEDETADDAVPLATTDDGDEDDEADEDVPAAQAATSGASVLVVAGRPRYHLATCRYLIGKAPEQVALTDVQAQGFSPCGVCKPDDALAAAPQDEAGHEAARQEAPQDDVGLDGTPQDDDEAPQDEAPQDEAPQDGTPQDGTPQDEAPPDGAPEATRPAAPAHVAGPSDEELSLEEVLFGGQVFGAGEQSGDQEAAAPARGGRRRSPGAPARRSRGTASVQTSADLPAEVVPAAPIASDPQPEVEGAAQTPAPSEEQQPEPKASAAEQPDAEQPVDAVDEQDAASSSPDLATPVPDEPPVTTLPDDLAEPTLTNEAPDEPTAIDQPSDETGPSGATAAATATAKRAPARTSPASQAPARKTPAKQTPAKKTPAKKTPAKKTPAKATPARQAPVGKAAATSAPATEPATQPGGPTRAPAERTPTTAPSAASAPAAEQVPTPARTTPVRAVRADALRLVAPTGAVTTRRVAVRQSAPSARPATPPAPAARPAAAAAGPAPRAGQVVVIPDRARFHRADCRYVRGVAGATALGKAAATKQGYVPCGVCRP